MDTKFQKKHESDMTAKEKRELEREKLASMHGKEKIEYILSYYKFHIGVVILLILLAVGVTQWIDDFKDENYIYATVINAPKESKDIMKDFRKSLGDEEEHHKYVLDTDVFLTRQKPDQEPSLDYTAQMKLSTQVGAASLDLMICPKTVYDMYTGQDMLYNISDLMGEDFVEEHKDICTSDAIMVQDNEVLNKYNLLLGNEDMYLIVFQYSEHPEIDKEFVEFLMK